MITVARDRVTQHYEVDVGTPDAADADLEASLAEVGWAVSSRSDSGAMVLAATGADPSLVFDLLPILESRGMQLISIRQVGR